MTRINAGIIGTGFIGPAHVEALLRIGGVRVVALSSNERARADGIASRFGIPGVYDRWEDLVADPSVAVVHNCTPNNLHFEINRAALAAGKHVVSEKPLTLTGRESLELVRLARESGMVNAVNYNYRFYPLVQQAEGMVRRGEIGDVRLVHGHYLQDWLFHEDDYNWRLEPAVGGASRAMADIGTHWCDLVQFVTGRKITAVSAVLQTVHPYRVKPGARSATFKGKNAHGRGKGSRVRVRTEDAAIVMFALEGGARGVVEFGEGVEGHNGRTSPLAQNHQPPVCAKLETQVFAHFFRS